MRANRLELIEKLKARAAELEKNADAEYAEALAKEDERARAYVKETQELWLDLAARIYTRTEVREPVLEEDIPVELRRMSRFGYRPAEVRRRPPATAELRRLIGLLETSPDETVSLASLERAGFVLGRVLK